MQYLEIAVCFLLGGALAAIAGFIFNLRTKGLFRIAVNSLAGGILLVLFSLTGLLNLALNPFNALLCGALGIFGPLIIIAVTVFL